MKEKTNENIPIAVLFVIYLLGLTVAVLYILQVFTIDANNIHSVVSVPDSIDTLTDLTKSVCIINLLFAILNFIFGFCVIGKPFLITLILLHGFFTGLQIASFALCDESNGLYFTFLVLIPTAVIYTIAQLCCGVQSVFLSNDLYNNLFKQEIIKTEIRTYLKRYILIIVLILLAIIYLFAVGYLFIFVLR